MIFYNFTNICQDMYFSCILMKYEIFYIKKYEFVVFNFFQKSPSFLYKSWFSTISLNIGQDTHFTDKLLKYRIFYIFSIPLLWTIRACYYINSNSPYLDRTNKISLKCTFQGNTNTGSHKDYIEQGCFLLWFMTCTQNRPPL